MYTVTQEGGVAILTNKMDFKQHSRQTFYNDKRGNTSGELSQ